MHKRPLSTVKFTRFPFYQLRSDRGRNQPHFVGYKKLILDQVPSSCVDRFFSAHRQSQDPAAQFSSAEAGRQVLSAGFLPGGPSPHLVSPTQSAYRAHAAFLQILSSGSTACSSYGRFLHRPLPQVRKRIRWITPSLHGLQSQVYPATSFNHWGGLQILGLRQEATHSWHRKEILYTLKASSYSSNLWSVTNLSFPFSDEQEVLPSPTQ